MSKSITYDEALELHRSGKGIITSGGYTFIGNYYLAYGALPGCLRGGDLMSELPIKEGWKQLNLKELICRNGFYPDPFSLHILVSIQATLEDYSINLNEMVKYCIDSSYTKEQLLSTDTFTESTIWYDYFQDKDDQLKKIRAQSVG